MNELIRIEVANMYRHARELQMLEGPNRESDHFRQFADALSAALKGSGDE